LTETFTILIADRNPYVRELLRRTLTAEDYHVWTAKDGMEVFMVLNVNKTPDLVILDGDIRHIMGMRILDWLKNYDSCMPIVVHDAAAFLEDSGNNVDGFTAVVAGVLRERYPDRFESFEKRDRLSAQAVRFPPPRNFRVSNQ